MNFSNLIDVLSLFLYDSFVDGFFTPVIILAFISVVPCLLRYFIFRR